MPFDRWLFSRFQRGCNRRSGSSIVTDRNSDPGDVKEPDSCNRAS